MNKRYKFRNLSTGIFIGVVVVLLGFSIQTGNIWGAGGDLLWEKQFDKAGGWDVLKAITVKSNTIFVTGYGENSSGNFDIVTLAYDAKTGNLLWEVQFDKAGYDDIGKAITLKGNTVFVTGRVTNSSVKYDIVTLAYDAKTGTLLWEAQFDKAGGWDEPIAIAVGSNAIFVTGTGENSSGNFDIVTLAYDAKTGNLLWEAQFEKAGSMDIGSTIAVKGNTIFVTGFGTNSSGNFDIVTLAYDAKTGNLLWEAQFDKAGGDDYGYAITVKGNTVFVTGYSRNSSGNFDIVTLAYDAKTGNLLWEAQFDKAGGGDYGYAIALGSNTVFITGECTNASGNRDIVTLAYDARTGNLRWEAQFDKAGYDDGGNAIALKGNTIFVTGWGTNASGNDDIVTLAYDAKTGNLLWEAQFDKAGGDDHGNAIAAGSSSVFVTGFGINASGNADIITLAYDIK